MLTVLEPALLADRLRRTPSQSTVPGAPAVLFFGDPETAVVATVGLNPSRLEYRNGRGEELDGEQRRFETLGSVGAESRGELTDDQVQAIVEGQRRYFSRAPYWRWFSRPERVLEGTRHSYRRDAVHLDLVQEPTDPTWSTLPAPERRGLLDADLPFLRHLLTTLPLELVLVDGKTARAEVFGLLELTPHSLGTCGKLQLEGGRARIANREVPVAGWNLPLGRAGLTREADAELGRVLVERLS